MVFGFGAVTVALAGIATTIQVALARAQLLPSSLQFTLGVVVSCGMGILGAFICALYLHFSRDLAMSDVGSVSHPKASAIATQYAVEQARKHEEAARLAQQERDAIATERDAVAQERDALTEDVANRVAREEATKAKQLALVNRALNLVDSTDELYKGALQAIDATDAMLSDAPPSMGRIASAFAGKPFLETGHELTPAERVAEARAIIAAYRNRDAPSRETIPIAKLSEKRTLFLGPAPRPQRNPWDEPLTAPRRIVAGLPIPSATPKPLDPDTEAPPSPESAS
ncbi:MAG: hypothetical protein JWM95_170 [Gemmatimonadetes bacterium]|nr:hypothetical protein [Gemmatimonadota bacterium]